MKKGIKLTEVILKVFLTCLLPAEVIFFELDPDGAIIRISNGPDSTSLETSTYFNPNPFGYANFVPFVTSILSVILLLFGVMFLLTGKVRGAKAECVVAAAAFLTSLIPLVGAEVITLPGIAISVLLLIQAVVSFALSWQISK